LELAQSSSVKILKPVVTGSLFYFLAFSIAGAYQPFLNVYFTRIGLTGEQVGLLSTFQPIITILFLSAIASLADRLGKKGRIAQFSMLGASISVFLLGFSASFGGIAVLMLFLSIFTAPNMTLTDSMISRMAFRHNLNYGGMRLWGSFMYAVAAAGFGALWQHFGYKPMFLAAALCFLPVIWITGRIEEGPAAVPNKNQPVRVFFRDRGMVLLLLATFLFGISNSIFLTFGGIYANSLGAGNLVIGLMVSFGCIGELPMMFFSNRISRRLGKVDTVILSFALMAAAYLGYLLTANPNFLPVYTLLKGLGYGLWFTVTIRLLIEKTPPERAATAQSLFTISWIGLSPLIAGPLGGWIHDFISPAAVFGLGIVSLFLASVVLIYARRTGKLS
jgi:MFS transporter, PPP family, 3-phenylpropionic acid transporter